MFLGNMLIKILGELLAGAQQHQTAESHCTWLVRGVTSNPGCNPPYSQEFPRGKKKKKKPKKQTKPHRDNGEQVPNSLMHFRAHRGDPHRKWAEFPQTPLPLPLLTHLPKPCAFLSQTMCPGNTAPKKTKEEHQKMANAKRLQQWRLKHRPVLSPEREKEILLWEDGNSSFYKHGCN